MAADCMQSVSSYGSPAGSVFLTEPDTTYLGMSLSTACSRTIRAQGGSPLPWCLAGHPNWKTQSASGRVLWTTLFLPRLPLGLPGWCLSLLVQIETSQDLLPHLPSALLLGRGQGSALLPHSHSAFLSPGLWPSL